MRVEKSMNFGLGLATRLMEPRQRITMNGG